VNIRVTDNEVERMVGLYVIEAGITLDEFDEQLETKGISVEDIRKSFETRAKIIKLFEKKYGSADKTNELIFDIGGEDYQVYINELLEESEIEILDGEVNEILISDFEETGDEICNEEKPVMRLYTTSWCEVCEESSKVFNQAIKNVAETGKIDAFHWSLDEGDDLLTEKKEGGLPQEEVDLFKRYSPENKVPAVVLGCKYKLIGNLENSEKEFNKILNDLIGE